MDNFNVPAPFLPSQIIEKLDLNKTSWWTWYARLQIAYKLYNMPKESYLIYLLNLVGSETYDMVAYKLHPISPINSTFERVVSICTQEYGQTISVPFHCFVDDVTQNQNEPAPAYVPPPDPSQPVVVNVVNVTSSTPARTNNQNTLTVTSSKVIPKRTIHHLPLIKASSSKRLRTLGGAASSEPFRQNSVPVAPKTSSTDLTIEVVSPAKYNPLHSKETIIQRTDLVLNPPSDVTEQRLLNLSATSDIHDQLSIHSFDHDGQHLLNQPSSPGLRKQTSIHTITSEPTEDVPLGTQQLAKEVSSTSVTQELVEEVPSASGTNSVEVIYDDDDVSQRQETSEPESSSSAVLRPSAQPAFCSFPDPCEELLNALRPNTGQPKRLQLPLYHVPSVHEIIASVNNNKVQLTPKEVSQHVVKEFMIAVNILPVPRDLQQVALNIVEAFPQFTHKDTEKHPEQLFFYHTTTGDRSKKSKSYKGYLVRSFSKVQLKSPTLEDVQQLYSANFNANNIDRINYLFTLTFPVREHLRSKAPKANKLLIKYFPSMLELGGELIDREFALIHAKSREKYTLAQLTDFYHQNINNSESSDPPSWDFLKWICQETKSKFERTVSLAAEPIAEKGIPMMHCENGTYSVVIQANVFKCDDDFERALEFLYKSQWIFLYPINALLLCYAYLAYDPPIIYKSYSSRFRAIANELFGKKNKKN